MVNYGGFTADQLREARNRMRFIYSLPEISSTHNFVSFENVEFKNGPKYRAECHTCGATNNGGDKCQYCGNQRME
jgi:hypothetical protein